MNRQVRRLALFGSFVRNQAGSASDVDLVTTGALSEYIRHIRDELERILASEAGIRCIVDETLGN